MPGLLLGIMLFQLLGFSVYFNLEKAKVRNQLKSYIDHGIPDEMTTLFELTPSEYEALSWMKYGKEFQHQDHYYDVLKQGKTKDGKLILRCVIDYLEKKLHQNLSFYVERNLDDQRGNSPVSVVFSSLHLPFLKVDFHFYFENNPLGSKPKNYFHYQDSVSVFSLVPPTPPPSFLS